MTKFKVGDKFIPRMPKNGDISLLRKHWNCFHTVHSVTNEWITARETGIMFHEDWCEKVEEHSVEPNKMRRHITEKELKIAASQIGLKLGVLEYLIARVRENQLQKPTENLE